MNLNIIRLQKRIPGHHGKFRRRDQTETERQMTVNEAEKEREECGHRVLLVVVLIIHKLLDGLRGHLQ